MQFTTCPGVANGQIQQNNDSFGAFHSINGNNSVYSKVKTPISSYDIVEDNSDQEPESPSIEKSNEWSKNAKYQTDRKCG